MDVVKQEPTTRFYEFGPFLVDTVKCALLREGEVVPLSLKAFEILLALIEHRGQVLEKDRLLKQVWPGIVVEENNLARNISALRKALDEHPSEHQYILTVPGRGYRFVASVREMEDGSEESRALALDQLRIRSLEGINKANGSEIATAGKALKEEAHSPKADFHRRWVVLTIAGITAGISVIVLAIYLFRQRTPPELPLSQRKLYQLTFDPGLESEPSWSPDGRLIAYSSDRSGNFDIWVQPVGEGNAVRVTTSSAHDWQPDWAPVGNRLVFRSERDGGGLFVVPVLGGNERKVSSFGYRPRWAPDGTQIFFYSSIPQINTVEIPKVFVVGLDGNPPREVLGRFRTEFNSLRVAWHPDGRRLSVWGDHTREGWSFWTVPLEGGAPVKSILSAQVNRRFKESDANLTDFQWSSSGRSLYFEGVSQSVRNIWRVEVEPQSLRWVSGPERLTTGTGQDTDITVSPDGRKLAFT